MMKPVRCLGLAVVLLLMLPSLAADIIDFPSDDLDYLLELPENSPTRSSTNIEVLDLILSLGLNEIMARDFFARTNSLNKRPIETLPLFWLIPKKCENLNWNVRGHLFGNINPKLFLSPSGTTLQDYLQLNEEFFEGLDADLFDVMTVLAPIAPGKIQQRRFGVMLQTFKQWHHWSLEALAGLMYDERNYYYTPEETALIESTFQSENNSAKTPGSGPGDNFDPIIRDHFVSDKLGITDLQFKLRHPYYIDNHWYFNVGIIGTIPTAFALKNGLYGANFVDRSTRPDVSIKQLIDLYQSCKDDKDQTACQNLETIFKNVAFQSLDRLGENLLQTPLGNSGHFGLGLLFEPQYQYNNYVNVPCSISFEYLFPVSENRFFIYNKDPGRFTDAALDAGGDEEKAREILNFLSTQIINTIYQEKRWIAVRPGFTCQFQIAPELRVNDCLITIGYDFWFRQAEQLGMFKNPTDSTQLNTRLNAPFSSCQQDIFLKICHKKINRTYDRYIGLGLEQSVMARGLSKDFSATLVFEINY